MFKRLILLAALALLCVPQAHAQVNQGAYTVSACGTPPNGFGLSGSGYSAGAWYPVTQDTAGKICTNASVSASIAAFAPATIFNGANGFGSGITGTSSKFALTGAAANSTLLVTNSNTTDGIYVELCPTSTCTATSLNGTYIGPGSSIALNIGANTEIAGISTGSGPDVTYVAAGTGLPALAGGGAGGGGGGGAVTIASGGVASGAYASGSIASGAFASGSISDGAVVTLGAKADAKNSATDSTAITVMQVLKEISAMEQAPASRAVTNAGTFAVQVPTQTPVTTASLATAKVVCAAACTLTGFELSADSTLDAAAWYILIFNATSDPGNGAVTPAFCYQVASGNPQAGGTFAAGGIAMSTGATIVASSTGCFTETQGGAHAFINGTHL